MSANGNKKVRFKYERAPDYRIVYANGAFGGPSPRGEMKFDLFAEVVMPPDYVVHALHPSGELGDELEREPSEPNIVRQAQIGVVMSLAEAKNLNAWLGKHINTLEQATKGKKNG